MLMSIISSFLLLFFVLPQEPWDQGAYQGPSEASANGERAHSTDDTTRAVCPFELSVNIKLEVFVYSRSVRPSVYTRYVYQRVLSVWGATCAVLYSKDTLYVSLHFCLYILNNGRKAAVNLVL